MIPYQISIMVRSVIAGGVRQDEIGRLRSPTIIIHSHFAIAAVYVVFVERLRRR